MGRRTRSLVAALLALAIAGLGHAYLRRWRRALSWFAVIVGTGIALMYVYAAPDTPVADLPPEVFVPLLVLFVGSAVDAYRLAARPPAEDDADGVDACPNCGRELDENIHFCPWCAEPVGEPPSDERPMES